MRIVLPVTAALVLACAGPTAAPPPPPAPKERAAPVENVLLVVLDDVGVDKVRAYGRADAPPTPTLDALAKEGVRFERAWAQPLCSPTRAALMTGRYPRRLGIGFVIDSWRDEPELAPDEVTIPELLGRAAVPWDTSQVGKWHLGSRRGDPLTHPGRQGFAWWAGTLGNLKDPWPGDRGEGPLGYERWRKNDNGRLSIREGYVTTDETDDAIARAATMREPWFLYVAYNGAHAPPHVPPAGLRTLPVTEASSDADQYDAVLEATDHELGRLLASLGERRARTTVIVMGDNGTPELAVRPPDDPERAKGTVYELGVHVPLVVTGPRVARPGSTSDALVHAVDVFATVADIAGVDPGSLGRPIDGVSLLPALADPRAEVRRFAYTARFVPNGPGPYGKEVAAVRDDRYKLVVDRQRDGDVVEQLFALEGGAEGPDLLGRGRVPDEVRAERARLRAELDRLEADFAREAR